MTVFMNVQSPASSLYSLGNLGFDPSDPEIVQLGEDIQKLDAILVQMRNDPANKFKYLDQFNSLFATIGHEVYHLQQTHKISTEASAILSNDLMNLRDKLANALTISDPDQFKAAMDKDVLRASGQFYADFKDM